MSTDTSAAAGGENGSDDLDLTPQPAEDAGRAANRAPDLAAVFETALIVTGVLAFGFILPHQVFADATDRYQTMRQLFDQGTISDNKLTIIGNLFALPLFAVARLLGRDEQRWAAMYNTVLFAAALAIMYALLRRHLPGALLRRFLLILIAGSMFAAHVINFNSEPFTALTVAVGLVAVAVYGRSFAGWTAVTFGIATTPAALVGLALVTAKRMWENRRLRYVLAGVGAVAIWMVENWIRRGGPLVTGYEQDHGYQTLMPYSGRPGFSYPIFFGLLSICLSFGKGLVFFAPGLLLPVRAEMRDIALREDTTLYRLYGWWLLFTAGLVLAYAPWWAWYGGLTWGPRFLLFASIPASLALAVRLWKPAEQLWLRVFTLVVLALSVWVGLDAAAFPFSAFLAECTDNNYAQEVLCHYTPDYSVLWYPFVRHLPLTRPAGVYMAAYCTVVFGYLAAPLVRSIWVDVATRERPALSGAWRNWRW